MPPSCNSNSRFTQGDIDLVVMATHGRGGAARLMMGSVADKIVRAAPCPVLTIRAAAEPGDRAHRTKRRRLSRRATALLAGARLEGDAPP
jgi:hypothetical protein